MAQLNDVKSFEFEKKGNSSKARACKVGLEETLFTKMINIKRKPSSLQQDNRKKGLRPWAEPVMCHSCMFKMPKVKDFDLRREPQVTILETVYLWNLFLRTPFVVVNPPGTHRACSHDPRKPGCCSIWRQILMSFIHMVLVYRRAEQKRAVGSKMLLPRLQKKVSEARQRAPWDSNALSCEREAASALESTRSCRSPMWNIWGKSHGLIKTSPKVSHRQWCNHWQWCMSRLSKPFRVHISSPLTVGAGQGIIGLTYPLSAPPPAIPPFWNGNVYTFHCTM